MAADTYLCVGLTAHVVDFYHYQNISSKMAPTLVVGFEEFRHVVGSCIDSFEKLKDNSYEHLQELQHDYQKTLMYAHKELSKLCDPPINYFTFELLNASPSTPKNIRRKATSALSFEQEIVNEEIQAKIDALYYTLKIIYICNYIKAPNSLNPELLSKQSLSNLRFFLLEKLSQVHGVDFYPIELILQGNGINPKYPGFFQDLVEQLQKDQLIELSPRKDFSYGRLSLKGFNLAEENRLKNDQFLSNRTKVIQNSSAVKALKVKWKKLLRSESLDTIIEDIFLKLASDGPLYGKFLQLSNQLVSLKNKRLKGTLTWESQRVEENKIIDRLLLLIGALEDQDISQ